MSASSVRGTHYFVSRFPYPFFLPEVGTWKRTLLYRLYLSQTTNRMRGPLNYSTSYCVLLYCYGDRWYSDFAFGIISKFKVQYKVQDPNFNPAQRKSRNDTQSVLLNARNDHGRKTVRRAKIIAFAARFAWQFISLLTYLTLYRYERECHDGLWVVDCLECALHLDSTRSLFTDRLLDADSNSKKGSDARG